MTVSEEQKGVGTSSPVCEQPMCVGVAGAGGMVGVHIILGSSPSG